MVAALDIRNLTKSYATGKLALRGVDLRVEQGDFFALLGPNGAGKSTLIGTVSGLVNKSGGTVEIFGHDIDREFSVAKKQLGVVPQEFNFNQFEKVIDIVMTQAGLYGLPVTLAQARAEKYLDKLGLWEKRNERSRFLSGGMKRRLMIARALVHEPRMLILDEPTAGVDIELRRSMWDFLKEINRDGTTIILTTHYLEEAESLCRNIAIIDQGSIVANTDMKSLLQQLNTETFVLDLRQNLDQAPRLTDYRLRLIDAHTLEVDLLKAQSLNDCFGQLSALGIEVISMRNKSNRLEELFLNMVESNQNKNGAVA